MNTEGPAAPSREAAGPAFEAAQYPVGGSDRRGRPVAGFLRSPDHSAAVSDSPDMRDAQPPSPLAISLSSGGGRRGSSGSNLLLALNLVLFAGLLFWIAYRVRQGEPLQPEAGAAVRDHVARVPPTGVDGSATDGLRLPDRDPVPPPPSHADEVDAAPPEPVKGPAGLPELDRQPEVPIERVTPPEPEPDPVPDQPLPVPDPVAPPEPMARPGGRAEAVAEIARLGVQLEIAKTVTGAYPSSRGSISDLNRGIEAVHASLSDAARSRIALAQDTDGDGRPEFLDPWGRPYVYVRADDYEAVQRIADGVTAPTVRTARGPRGAGRYQLRSLGRDGVDDLGGGDDVTSWSR
jgi:hypothetical protein